MNKRNVIIGALVGAVVAICLLALIFLAMPYIYLSTENRNFEKLRKKSELDCETMPLHCLAREENTEEIKKYVSGGGDLAAKDNWGRTALFWALDDQKLHIASLLLTLGADPNTKEENGISVFYRAVVSGKYYFADALLDSGADIDIFNDDTCQETTLHHCVMKNNLECVAYLISKGANKNLEDSFGYTVFERLQMHDHITNEIRGLLKQ